MTFKSITEVAQMKGISREAVWKQYKTGKFPNAQVIGNQIAIPDSDLFPTEIPGAELPKKAAGHAVSFLNLAIAAAMLIAGLLAIQLTMPALGSF